MRKFLNKNTFSTAKPAGNLFMWGKSTGNLGY